MRLSSTKKTWPRQPAAWSASSSARTCGADLTRGWWPNFAVTSQILAVERTAARELQRHRAVAGQLGEIPARHGRGAHVGKGRARVEAARAAGGEIAQKIGQRQLGLVEHEVIDGGKVGVGAGEKRPAGDDGSPGGVAAGDDLLRGGALRDHGADTHDVRPGEVAVRERAHVEIDQTQRPVAWQHRRDREEAERRERGALADEFQGVLETPERVGEFGVEQEGAHRRKIARTGSPATPHPNQDLASARKEMRRESCPGTATRLMRRRENAASGRKKARA